MAFSDLLDNQMVSYNISTTGNFTLMPGQISSGSDQCMTKLQAFTMYNLVATPGSNGISDNQLMQKSFWENGDVCSFTAEFIDVVTIPPPVCSDRVVVFQICNSNAVKDDNFDIYLNGAYIGKVDLSQNTQIGSVFIASEDTAVNLSSSDFVCPLSGMVTYRFSPSLLKSYNLLEMRNTLNNNNNNQGTLGFRNYLRTGNSLSNPTVLADLSYNGSSGVSFNFNFEWTSCT